MNVPGKLLLILVIVAAVPLGVSTVTSLGTYERELERRLDELHVRTAEYGARATSGTIDTAQRTLRGLALAIPWAALSDEERRGALLLIYEQLEDVVVVRMLDGDGRPLGQSIHTVPAKPGNHPSATDETLDAFGTAIQPASPGHGWTTGAPIIAFGSSAPLIPMSLSIEGPGGTPWSLAAGLSLRGVCHELAATTPPGVTTRLVTATGGRLCGPAPAAAGTTIAANITTPHGWHIVVEQPRELAFASVHRIRRQTVFWIVVGVLAAIVAGLVLSQALRRPLRQLTAGAEALARGDLDHRVRVDSRDEFGTLAQTFNRMSAEIERQAAEVKRWNEELQLRVDARTAELKDAQNELMQSRKLGAVAALGAGIAHEINNPLTGVLGMTQILLGRRDQLDPRTGNQLATIEREALRIRDIVERMSSLARESVGDAVRVDLVRLVEAVADAHAGKLATARVEVERSFPAGLPGVLGNAHQLAHVVTQLVDNSIKAMPSGGRLKLTVRSIEGELVAIEIADTGRGIPPELLDRIFEPFFTTKDDWRGVGLGLTLAHRIVEVHNGRLRASSQVGAGTTMTILLPAASQGAHLH